MQVRTTVLYRTDSTEKSVAEFMPPPSRMVAERMAVDEVSPSQWVPHFRCVKHFKLSNLGVIEHLRGGHSDAAHGAVRISEGRHRITYKIRHASSSAAFGMLLGVTDCNVWDPPGFARNREVNSIFTEMKMAANPPRVAWGLCPSSGKLFQTHDVRMGHLQGALLVQQLFGSVQSRRQSVEGTTVVVEVNMLPRDETASMACRDFDTTLHPLTFTKSAGRRSERPPLPCFNTLAFSVNGSDMVQADVCLPAAVWPWVLLTWEGDAVELVSVEMLGLS